jgi:hypothetical protein
VGAGGGAAQFTSLLLGPVNIEIGVVLLKRNSLPLPALSQSVAILLG